MSKMKNNQEDDHAWKKSSTSHNDDFTSLHQLKGLLYPGTKNFSLACVTLVIIMDTRLYIANPMHGI